MSQEKSERKAVDPNPISSKKILGHGPITGKLRPSAKDAEGVAYFKTFNATTPITNFQKQQQASLQAAYQDATATITKIETTDGAGIRAAKDEFAKYLTSFQLEQNAAFDNLVKGFQNNLQSLSNEQKAPNGKDAETTYNEMQRIRSEQTEALKNFLEQSQGASDRNISSEAFAAKLQATGANPQQVAATQQALKESLQKQRKKQQEDFDNLYKTVLLDEQAKLMTEQSRNVFIQREFLDVQEKQFPSLNLKASSQTGDAAPTGEPLQLPAPFKGGRMATKIDGHYFIVNDKGGVHIDARGLNRDDRMIYLRSALSYYPANGINTIDFNSTDPELIDDVIEVATKLGITVKNQNARPSIPADRWFESRKEPVAVTLAKWQALKEEFEKDLQLTSGSGDDKKVAQFKDISQTVENVDNLSLQIKQKMANVKFPDDLNIIQKSSQDAGITTPLTREETLNKLQQLEGLHKTHTDQLGKLLKNLDQLSEQLKTQADNYKFALNPDDEKNLSRRIHAGAQYTLNKTFIPLVKKFLSLPLIKSVAIDKLGIPPAFLIKEESISQTKLDAEKEKLAEECRQQYGVQQTVDLNELSSEAAEKVESLRVNKQMESIENNVVSLVENYDAVEQELLKEYNFLLRSISSLRQDHGNAVGADPALRKKYDTLWEDYNERRAAVESHLEFSTPNDPSTAKLASRYTQKMEETVNTVMQKIPEIAEKQGAISHSI